MGTGFNLKNFLPFQNKFDYEIGICLSGGSARGYAHVGVLKALLENGIEPQIISGTSMGAIVGVLLAAGYAPEEMAEILTKETFSKVTGIAWQRTGLLKMEKLRPVLKKYLPEDNFSQLKKPFYVGLANLNEGTNVIRHRGALYDNIIASCSVPGIFAPVPIDDELYVDGGLLCNLPASAIRDKCRILIGSHVNFPGRKQRFLGPRSIVERAVNIGITQNAKAQMEQCDYLIDPPDMQYYSLVDFSKIKEIIETGYRHTMAMIASGELPLKKLQRASQKGNS